MPTRWECLRDAFDRIVHRADPRAFIRAARHYDALAPFDELRDLHDYLLARSHDLDERDHVLAALVQLARECDDEVVSALLWIALWPGLSNVFARRVRRRWDADEVISALTLAFTLAVHEVEVARVHRVAATLTRNTDRRVADLLRAPREEVGREDLLEQATRQPAAPDPAIDLRLLRDWLATSLGSDGDLLLGVIAFGETKIEAAERMGLTTAAAHKRFQRAIIRLRAHASDLASVAGACA